LNTTARPAKKPRISLHLQGVILLLLAVALLWAGQHFDRRAQQGHHRLLVSTAKVRGDVFEKSVVFVMHHLKSGATGIVLNKDNTGGPVGAENVFTLHTLDAKISDSYVLRDLQIGVIEGRVGAEKLLAQTPPPAWHVTVQGYAGWRGRQLDYEIDQGEWRVIAFDKDIVRLKGQAMWDAADSIASKAEKQL
jgi:putative transcriptional regulator